MLNFHPKRMGKNPFSFRRRRSTKKRPTSASTSTSTSRSRSRIEIVPTPPNESWTSSKRKKKTGGLRLWMKFDRFGQSQLIEWDKSSIINRVGIPGRDLRILGPVFSHSSHILGRERAMVVNLEFIKAIVTAEEVLLLDPFLQEVLPFVHQLQQLSRKSVTKLNKTKELDVDVTEMHSVEAKLTDYSEVIEGEQEELPFEFQVLEIALEVMCSYLETNVIELKRNAYPLLDELARNVSTKSLERVRSLKSSLARLLARVQKVRDEIEQLLDDNEDMAHLYLTRKAAHYQQFEVLLNSAPSTVTVPAPHYLRRMSSYRSASLVSGNYCDDDDVEDLEMLLEAYFMQLDGTRNKILSVREYIDDTEDYVNIQLDNHRNELIQLQVVLSIVSFAVALDTLFAAIFGMNIPCSLFKRHPDDRLLMLVIGGATFVSFFIFVLIYGYAKSKKLLGS